MALELSRRGFFAGLGATLIAAPAIVRASSLMPVRALVVPTEEEVRVFLEGRLVAEGGKFVAVRVTDGGAGYVDMPLVYPDPVRMFHEARNRRLTRVHGRVLTFT